METTEEKQAQVIAEPPADTTATQAMPVMDVVPPPSTPPVDAGPVPEPPKDAEFVEPPAGEASPEDSPNQLIEDEARKESALAPSQAQAAKPPKSHSSGTAAAIVATVIIVLALSVLTVYAYLQTK